MEKIDENTYYQIAYDFKVFIRESLIYDYDLDLLMKFADYMDSIYYPTYKLYNKWLSIPYVNIDKVILRDTFELQLYNKCISDKIHIDNINSFIKIYYNDNNLPMINSNDRYKSGICLYDFIVASSSVIFDWNNDNFDDFASYMLNEYPNMPYDKIAKMINKLDNSNNKTLTCAIDQNLCKFVDGSFSNYHIGRDRYEYIMMYETGCFKSKMKFHQ